MHHVLGASIIPPVANLINIYECKLRLQSRNMDNFDHQVLYEIGHRTTTTRTSSPAQLFHFKTNSRFKIIIVYLANDKPSLGTLPT